MRNCYLECKRREKKKAMLGFLFCGFCEISAPFAFNSLRAQGASA